MPQPSGSTPQSNASNNSELQSLIIEGLPEGIGLTPMKGFKMDLSANAGFQKAFFSARCECGTAALLSVEVSEDKTDGEISSALPSLISRLETQARSFYSMPCDTHKKMRMGPTTGQ